MGIYITILFTSFQVVDKVYVMQLSRGNWEMGAKYPTLTNELVKLTSIPPCIELHAMGELTQFESV